MRGLYSIPFRGLKEGSHQYDFKIDSKFFASFDRSEIHEAALEASVNLLKRSSHMEMRIKITGTALLTCDRCLDLYTQNIDTDDVIIIKFGEEWEEVDDEVIIIPHGESEFILDQLIYEFSHLGLPLKKMHPDDENGRSTCNHDMLIKLNEHLVGDENKKHDQLREAIEKFKNINN